MTRVIDITKLFNVNSEAVIHWDSKWVDVLKGQTMSGHLRAQPFKKAGLHYYWLSTLRQSKQTVIDEPNKGFVTFPLTPGKIKQVNDYQPPNNDWEVIEDYVKGGYYEIMEAINGGSVNPYERISPMIIFQKLCFKLYATDCKVPDSVLQSIINTGAMMGREIIALAKEKGSTKHKSIKYKR